MCVNHVFDTICHFWLVNIRFFEKYIMSETIKMLQKTMQHFEVQRNNTKTDKAKKSEVITIAQKIFSYYDSSQVYFLAFNNNKLKAKIGIKLFESLEDYIKDFQNVTFENSITITKNNFRQECILLSIIDFS